MTFKGCGTNLPDESNLFLLHCIFNGLDNMDD